MRFDAQTITVTDKKDRPYQIDALVAMHDDGTPVGLAVHPVYDLGPGPITLLPDEFTVTHVPSGGRLHHIPVPTEGTARRWLVLIASLADWTRTSRTFRLFETLRLQVCVARVQALNECESEHSLSVPRSLSSPPAFGLESVTRLIEWITYGMEYVALPPDARPALDGLLAVHADLARQQDAAGPVGRL